MTKELSIKELVIEQDEGYITQEGAGSGIKPGDGGIGIEQDHGTITGEGHRR